MDLFRQWKKAQQSSQCLRYKFNIVRIHGNVSGCSLRVSLGNIVWKMPVEQDICHRLLKQPVVTSILPLFFEITSDHKHTAAIFWNDQWSQAYQAGSLLKLCNHFKIVWILFNLPWHKDARHNIFIIIRLNALETVTTFGDEVHPYQQNKVH